MEILKSIDKVCLVDVGYHKGHFVDEFIKKHVPRNRLRIVAIDPMRYNQGICDEFHQVAISTEVGKMKFNLYDEPGCNSLHELKTENRTDSITHNGWYCAYPIHKTGEIQVDVVRLDSILEKLNEPIIHFLKIDTQGNDINVIKSCGDYLNKIMFIQMESCVAKNQSEIMYENQSTIEYDVKYMKDCGFEVLNITDYSDSAPPEANIIFYNKSLVDVK
jgi:FkbM family methyltransferase